MKKFFLLLLIAGCASGSHVMTMNEFQDIPIGSTPEQIEEVAGTPFAIHHKKDGVVEYEYVEKLRLGARNLNERHYYLVIRDGQLVSKRVEQQSPGPYYFDSYQMQTTQN